MNCVSKIESILFAASAPLSESAIARAVGAPKKEVRSSLAELKQAYDKRNARGIQLVMAGDGYQLVSHPRHAELVSAFTKQEAHGELTEPALETLTIIAYRGPVTKPEIEQLRGVNCGLILRNLAMRGLIVKNEKTKDGYPLYEVSVEFIKFLGICSVRDLPQYEALHANPTIEEALAASEEG